MINKKSFSEQIYESLKQDVITQKISFGQKLINRELQERFGVSSTPVRDAINRLYQDGLVENITKSGAAVISFRLTLAEEINEVLCTLCSGAVKLALQKAARQTVVAALEQCITQQKKHENTERYFYYDYRFHEIFFDFCGNARLQSLYEQYSAIYQMLARCYHRLDKIAELSIVQHEAMVAAYQKGDLEKTLEEIQGHYDHATLLLRQFWEGQKPESPR